MEPLFINKRSAGNTTRIVDAAVQELFNTNFYCAKGKDHHKSESTDRYLFEKLINRLYNEHNLNKRIKLNKAKLDQLNLTVELYV